MASILRIPSIWFVLFNLLFQGCASYQPGSGSTTPFSTIQINPVKNLSLLPQANHVVNHDLRETFIQSGKPAVLNSGAEATLEVTLKDYSRETIATNSRDTGLARKYTLRLSAECSLGNPTTGNVYFTKRPVSVDLDVYLDSGQSNAETNAIPLLSKKLAEAIASEVLRTW